MSAPKPSKPPTKEFVKLLEGRNQSRADITGVGPDGHYATKSVEGSAVVLKKEDK